MLSRDRYLVVFSIATSLLSASLGFADKFIQSIREVDLIVIFFSGIFILVVILILLFFLIQTILKNIILVKRKQLLGNQKIEVRAVKERK